MKLVPWDQVKDILNVAEEILKSVEDEYTVRYTHVPQPYTQEHLRAFLATPPVIYSTSEVNSKVQVDSLKEYAKTKGWEVIEKGISASSEVNQAITSVVGKADVLYVPTDNLVVSSMPIIAKVANENKLPIIASDEGSVTSGALACGGVDYYQLGYKTGEMAVQILKGEKQPSDLAVETMDEPVITMNEDTMKTLGIEKPADMDVKLVKTEN